MRFVCKYKKTFSYIFSVPATFQLLHAVTRTVEVAALPNIGESNEPVIPVLLDPPEPEEASQNIIPPSQGDVQPSMSSQVPVTDPSAVATKSVKTKPKGRAAKRQKLEEQLNSGTNTATMYLDVETDQPVSLNTKEIPAYLLKPAPIVLQTEDLRKHVMISDIEKNRALTHMANKISNIMPTLQSVLCRFNPTQTDNSADHLYQSQN